MPKLWTETIDSHRRQVQDAVVDAAAALILEHGPLSVSMSAIAERAGIGRATLYKYFPDVESILRAWHARDFGDRLAHLTTLAQSPTVTLDDVIDFVRTQRNHHDTQAATHIVGNLAHAVAGHGAAMPDAIEGQIIDALTSLMRQLARRKQVRADLQPEDLARWMLHVLHAPAEVDDEALARLLATSLARPSRRSPRAAPR